MNTTPFTTSENNPPTAPLTSVPTHERPQERLEKLGARALQDAELVAMLLRSGTVGENVLTVASRLVHEAGSLGNLVAWTREDFAARRGIGHVKALQLVTVMEIARRIMEQGKEAAPLLESPAQVYPFFRDIIHGLDIEKCWVLCLNTRHRLIRCVEITSGTANSTLIHPREVFRPVLRLGASAAILAHNHPGGDPEPSKSDIVSTRQLRDAANILGVGLLDHIILGNPASDARGQGWFSFKNAGLL
ncbi:MAG: DNA repair protein RadC [Puniceicoccales bacterium]|jgi:DNA repair protein RadC|nr:DNA repair protein RadC [Puniceicoccales bacterium]